MEITTCEQYVLVALEQALRENKALRDKVQELLNKLADASKEPEYIEQRVADIGRRLVFEEWFYTHTAVEAETFDAFCEEVGRYSRPKDVSLTTAVREFTPELEALWQEVQAEREAEREDAERATHTSSLSTSPVA